MEHRDSVLTMVMYAVTSLICAVLCWWVTSSVVLSIVPAVALLMVVEVLSRNLPIAVRDCMTANCRRADGTWSVRRERAEAIAVRHFRGQLLFAFTIILLPTYGLVWFVHTQVIPVPLGIDAIRRFESPAQAWRENLNPVEQQLDRWGRENGMTSTQVESRKRILWQAWPAVIALGLGWTIAVLAILRSVYFKGLKELAESIQSRRWRYHLRDSHSAHGHGG